MSLNGDEGTILRSDEASHDEGRGIRREVEFGGSVKRLVSICVVISMAPLDETYFVVAFSAASIDSVKVKALMIVERTEPMIKTCLSLRAILGRQLV